MRARSSQSTVFSPPTRLTTTASGMAACDAGGTAAWQPPQEQRGEVPHRPVRVGPDVVDVLVADVHAEQRQQRARRRRYGTTTVRNSCPQAAPGEVEVAGQVAGDEHERRHVPVVEEVVDRRRRRRRGSRVHECPTTTRVTSSILALSNNGSRDGARGSRLPGGAAGACSVVMALARWGTGSASSVPRTRLAETVRRQPRRSPPRLAAMSDATSPDGPPPQRQRIAAYAVLVRGADGGERCC